MFYNSFKETVTERDPLIDSLCCELDIHMKRNDDLIPVIIGNIYSFSNFPLELKAK